MIMSPVLVHSVDIKDYFLVSLFCDYSYAKKFLYILALHKQFHTTKKLYLNSRKVIVCFYIAKIIVISPKLFTYDMLN